MQLSTLKGGSTSGRVSDAVREGSSGEKDCGLPLAMGKGREEGKGNGKGSKGELREEQPAASSSSAHVGHAGARRGGEDEARRDE